VALEASASDVRLGVAVLSYEPGATIIEGLRSVLASSQHLSEVLVVDNASTKDSLEPLRAAYPQVRLLSRETNDGYGVAMNEAGKALASNGCNLLMFMTQDLLIADGCVEALLTALSERRGAGIVGPVIALRSSPETVWSAGGQIGRFGRPRHIEAAAALQTLSRMDRSAAWLDGACLLMTTETFKAVGGFREDLFLYCEDIDICLRVRDVGGSCTCVGSALAYQEPSMTPPYLAARIRLLVVGGRALIGLLFENLARLVRWGFVASERRRAWLMLRGGLDAAWGRRLNRSLALQRP
jgi:GT2 family glycosyltransferase